jgi:hypothetical protein
VPSRALGPGRCGLAGVGLEAGEDGVADLALEFPERLFVRFSLGQLLLVVCAAFAVPVNQVLGQLRMGQGSAQSHASQQGQPEENDLDRAPAPPPAGAAE